MTEAKQRPSLGIIRKTVIQECMEAIGNLRASEAGLFDPAHSGQRGEDRSNALYDAYQLLRTLAAKPQSAPIHMTIETIVSAFTAWRKTLTIADRPSNEDIFCQGYVAGWGAAEASLQTPFCAKCGSTEESCHSRFSAGNEGEIVALKHDIERHIIKVADLEKIVDVLESNARMQAKLLADTGRERDQLRTQLQEVQDTWLVGGPDLKAMSGSVESDRVIQLHFRRPVNDKDREWLLEAINEKIASQLSRPLPGVPQP